MSKLTGKVIAASKASDGRRHHADGPNLRHLRLMSGLTQAEMATRLNVQQAAVSKIEKGHEVYLSTVRRYVEALGASLRVDAVFSTDSRLFLRIADAFQDDFGSEDQLVLPLLPDSSFRANRDIVLSIKPKYSDKILTGQKTVELRRRFPLSAPKGTIAYIYSTSPTRALVGQAEIKDVIKLPIAQMWNEFEDCAFIDKADFERYFSGLEFGFAILLGDARSFTKAITLEELRERYDFEPPQSYLYASLALRTALENEEAVVST